jgi:hypothetical protein
MHSLIYIWSDRDDGSRSSPITEILVGIFPSAQGTDSFLVWNVKHEDLPNLQVLNGCKDTLSEMSDLWYYDSGTVEIKGAMPKILNPSVTKNSKTC